MDRKTLLAQMKQTKSGPAAEGAPVGVETKPDKGMPTTAPTSDVPAAPTSGPAGFDGSGYGSWSGYLQAAARHYQPTLQAAKSEQEAKSLAQAYLASLAPELEKRGAKFGGAKNETINVNGREFDMYRDIGGLSEAQMLEMGLPSAGGAAGRAMGTMGGGLPGMAGAMMNSASLVPTDASTYEALLRRIQEANGPEAIDREALMALMAR